MFPINLYTISIATNAKLVGKGEHKIYSVVTDSRIEKYKFKESLFIALNGSYFDGHDFAKEAVLYGSIAIMVNHYLPINIPQLIVNNTHKALGELSYLIRKKSKARILALTGSSGKTSVKEMTSIILKQKGLVLSTKENFNNEIGVPITLLNLTKKHKFAVIELGANSFNEIAWTTSLVKPEAALINNIYISHLSGFKSKFGIAKAKGEIFTGLLDNGIAIINEDSNNIKIWKKIIKDRKVWRFSIRRTNKSDFFAENIIKNNKGYFFTLNSPFGKCSISLSLLGEHNISNSLAASALSLSVGADLSDISYGLSKIKPIKNRLFPVHLKNDHILIDDSYNSNIGSMNAAIKVLSEMPGYKILVVGDITELGEKQIYYHKYVGKIISLTNINKVLSIGEMSYFISNESGCGIHFKEKMLLIDYLFYIISRTKKSTILVKGSHATKMYKITNIILEEYYDYSFNKKSFKKLSDI